MPLDALPYLIQYQHIALPPFRASRRSDRMAYAKTHHSIERAWLEVVPPDVRDVTAHLIATGIRVRPQVSELERVERKELFPTIARQRQKLGCRPYNRL